MSKIPSRFLRIIQLIQGLLSIPYSNVPIERAFNDMKLIKTNRRLKLKKKSKNLTKTTKIENFDLLLYKEALKRVKEEFDNNSEPNQKKR